MDETLTATPPAEDAAYYQKAIAECFAEIDRLHEQMARDQADIERSQARTWATLTEIKTILAKSNRKAA